MEEDVDRIELLAHYGNNPPRKSELAVSPLVGRHAYDVYHGSEPRNRPRRAARARANDYYLCADIVRKRAGRVRQRLRKTVDVIVRVAYICNVLRVGFRLLCNFSHRPHGLNGEFARRCFAREHYRRRPVVNGVCHVRNFRPRRSGLFNHRFKHFGSRNRALSAYAALSDNLFLNGGQFLVRYFNAEVAPRNHYALADLQNLVKVIYARAALYFGNYFYFVVYVAAFPQPVSYVQNILRLRHERAGYKVNALFDAEFEVGFILF